MYTDVLRRLRDADRRKRPEKWRTIGWFLIHENAPTHRSFSVLDFLAQKKVTTLDHCPHFPDLAPADFYLFPRLKSALNTWRFCDSTDIIKHATEKKKRISKNGFQEYYNTFTVGGRSVKLHKGTNVKVM
jgi:hypothetical protein